MKWVLSILHLFLAVSALAQNTLPSSFAPMGRIGMGATGTPIPAVAWYKLDGNALDSSGNGADGTVSGVEAYQTGMYGQALTVSNSYMTGSCCEVATNEITVATWARLDASQQSAMVARYDTAAKKRVWTLYFNPTGSGLNSVEFFVSANGYTPDMTTIARVSGQSITDGQWRHFAGSWKAGEKAKLYIDGVMVNEASAAQSAMYQTDVLMTVGRFANNVFQMRGASDDVRIYDRALSEDNIKRIMESQDNEPLEELQ